MIENEIAKLSEMSDRSLDQLEADVWKGVDARVREKRISTAVISCQATVFAIAVMVSVVAGTQVGEAMSQSQELVFLSTRADLAPSTLLIGR